MLYGVWKGLPHPLSSPSTSKLECPCLGCSNRPGASEHNDCLFLHHLIYCLSFCQVHSGLLWAEPEMIDKSWGVGRGTHSSLLVAA